jgi:hypothetical protein
MNNCPECLRMKKEISELKELQDPDQWEKALKLQNTLMNEIRDLQKEIDDAKALLAEYSSSPIAKDRTLMDAVRNMLAVYVANRDALEWMEKEHDMYACPECLQLGCSGGHR